MFSNFGWMVKFSSKGKLRQAKFLKECPKCIIPEVMGHRAIMGTTHNRNHQHHIAEDTYKYTKASQAALNRESRTRPEKLSYDELKKRTRMLEHQLGHDQRVYKGIMSRRIHQPISGTLNLHYYGYQNMPKVVKQRRDLISKFNAVLKQKEREEKLRIRKEKDRKREEERKKRREHDRRQREIGARAERARAAARAAAAKAAADKSNAAKEAAAKAAAAKAAAATKTEAKVAKAAGDTSTVMSLKDKYEALLKRARGFELREAEHRGYEKAREEFRKRRRRWKSRHKEAPAAKPAAIAKAAPKPATPKAEPKKVTCKPGMRLQGGKCVPPRRPRFRCPRGKKPNFPSNWYDRAAQQRYLDKYKDVAAAVRGGSIRSGLFHYACTGSREGRSWSGLERPGNLRGIFANWDWGN